MKVDVLNSAGKPTGRSVELDDKIFGIEPNDHCIYLAVKQFRATQRQGTHSAKERWAIKGSTRKIKKQKGTGTARAGSIKNPLFKGGGRVFGPRPRDYWFKLNQKVKRLARNSALTYKAKENSIFITEDVSFDQPKTSEYAGLLKSLGVNGQRTLLVLKENNKNVQLSARNIQKTEVALASKLNTYDILKAGALILTESAAAEIK